METEREISIGDPGLVAANPPSDGGPKYVDVVRHISADIPTPRKAIEELVGEQTAAIGRIAVIAENMAEWRILHDKFYESSVEELQKDLYEYVYWFKASVLFQAVIATALALMMLFTR